MTAALDIIAYRWKAVAAFLAPGVVILAAPMTQGAAPSVPDLWMALAASLLAAFAVERVENRPMPGTRVVDPTGIVSAEDEDVEYADDYVAGLEDPEPYDGRRIKGED